MSVTAISTPASSLPEPSSLAEKVDASCCFPVGYLMGAGTFWLALGLLFEFLTSLKFHNPRFLADIPYLTYGRLQAAHVTCFLYGFGVPVAVGAGHWLLARLGAKKLVAPAVTILGTVIWNGAVTVGIIAILCGDGTGYSAFEMPLYVAALLFVGYFLMTVGGMLTYHRRQEGQLYPSQWFVLGAFFWFPWIFLTAAMLLIYHPVRGVMQASVGWWYAQNLSVVFLGLAGLAVILYFIPKLLVRPLHSYYLAVFTFWTLVLFGGWGGFPIGAPFPAWMVSLAITGTVLTLVPLLGMALNIFQTARRQVQTLDAQITLRFCYVALFFWLIAGLQQIIGVVPSVSVLVDFTLFSVARWDLFHYGFFTFAAFGAIYYILPRLLPQHRGFTWRLGLIKGHFWLTFFGVLISYFALLAGGIGQGLLLDDPRYSFLQVMKGTLVPLRADTLGILLVLVGTICFLLNLSLLLTQHSYRQYAVFKKELL